MYVPGPLYCTYGLHVCTSLPRAVRTEGTQGSLPRAATASGYSLGPRAKRYRGTPGDHMYVWVAPCNLTAFTAASADEALLRGGSVRLKQADSPEPTAPARTDTGPPPHPEAL